MRNKIVVLRSAFLGIRYFKSGFQMSTPSSRLANGRLKPRGPADAIACRASILSCETGMFASNSYPMAAFCLSSSESASFERAPETMSWIQV